MENELIEMFRLNPMKKYEFIDIHNSFSFWFRLKIKILHAIKKLNFFNKV